MLARGGVIAESDKMVTVANINWQNENDYPQWRQQQKEAAAAVACNGPDAMDLAREIAGFQVMRKTPMEAMNFIVELQAKLNNSNG